MTVIFDPAMDTIMTVRLPMANTPTFFTFTPADPDRDRYALAGQEDQRPGLVVGHDASTTRVEHVSFRSARELVSPSAKMLIV